MNKVLTICLSVGMAMMLSANLFAQEKYWTEAFEDTLFPSSGKTQKVTRVTVATGTWILYYTYRTNSSTGVPIGTSDLRVEKNAKITNPTDGIYCYVVTPILANGIGTLSFYEGRGRTLTIETSIDTGKTWVVFGTVTTTAKAQNPVVINDAKANRIKISNQSSSDADIDELSITKYAGTAVGQSDVNPTGFTLNQNYPNPFNPSTRISFSLERDTEVQLKVFSATGQEIVTLVNGSLRAGRHEAVFNADRLPAGVYLYRLIASNQNHFKKMILMK